MRVGFQVPASRAMLEAALEGLTRMNVELMRRRNFPPLYKSGVRYRREPRGKEEWLTYDQVLKRRFADCEDLSAIRAAELRVQGIPAWAVVDRTGRRRFHALVEYGDGTREDPSRILGMGKGKRKR